jgi:hypothetical protein
MAISIAICGASAEVGSSEVDPGPPELTCGYWEIFPTPKREPYLISVDPDCAWLAMRGQESGRLRVWQLADDLRLGDLVFDSEGQPFVVGQTAWAGDRLIMYQLLGVRNWLRFDKHPPPDVNEYVTENSRIVALNPKTAEMKPVAATRGDILLGHHSSGAVAVFNGLHGIDGLEMTIYRGPDYEVQLRIQLELGEGYRGQEIMPFAWHPDGRHIFAMAVAVTEQPIRHGTFRGHRKAFPAPVAISVGDGAVRNLLADTSMHLLPYGNWALTAVKFGSVSDQSLTPTTVRQHTRIACLLTDPAKPVLAPRALVAVGLDGVEASYSFPLRAVRGPEEVQQKGHLMQPLTVTPDGQKLLLQQLPMARSARDAGEFWIWAWDLAAQRARRLMMMGEVTNIIRWYSEDTVILETEDRVGWLRFE